jgi:hypothetical protein
MRAFMNMRADRFLPPLCLLAGAVIRNTYSDNFFNYFFLRGEKI